MPPEKEYSFTIENYFPLQFILLGILGIGVAIFLSYTESWVYLLFVGIPSAIMAFTQKGTSINISKSEFKKHFSIAGIKIAYEENRYTKIEKLSVKKIRVSQTMNSRGNSSTIRYNLYKGFLIADGQARLITESKNKDYVIEKLENLAKELDTVLVVE